MKHHSSHAISHLHHANAIIGAAKPLQSRKSAIQSGLLIDVTKQAKHIGFKFPIAITRKAFDACVKWGNEVDVSKRHLNTEGERLDDLLQLCLHYIKTRKERYATSITFFVFCLAPKGKARANNMINLKVNVCPGDNLEHTMTILLETED